MSARDLLLFLVGHRGAIQRVARHRSSLWVGAAFVLGAALAREYDQEDLLREPWYLLLPFVASTAAAWLLYWKFCRSFRVVPHDPRDPSPLRFRHFLATFWFTAPLAWIYAIPFERFLTETDAAVANLLTLALVATWRVVLIGQVLSVLFRARPAQVLVFVLLFGNAVLFLAFLFSPYPIVEIMSGTARQGADHLLYRVTQTMRFYTFVAFLPILTLYVFVMRHREPVLRPSVPPETSRLSIGLKTTIALPILALSAALPRTQPPVALRHAVESHFDAGRPERAIALLLEHERGDLPRFWSPPLPARDLDSIRAIANAIAPLPDEHWLFRAYAHRTCIERLSTLKRRHLDELVVEDPSIREFVRRSLALLPQFEDIDPDDHEWALFWSGGRPSPWPDPRAAR